MGVFKKIAKNFRSSVDKGVAAYKEKAAYDRETRKMAMEAAKKERRTQTIKTAVYKEKQHAKIIRKGTNYSSGGFGAVANALTGVGGSSSKRSKKSSAPGLSDLMFGSTPKPTTKKRIKRNTKKGKSITIRVM